MARLASAEAPPPFCASDAARFTLSVVDPAFAPYFLTPSAPGVDTFGVDPKPTPSIPSAALIPAPYFPSRAAAILRAAEVEAPPPARFAAVTLALRRELDVVLALKLAPPPSARGAGNVAFATSSICPRKCGVWPISLSRSSTYSLKFSTRKSIPVRSTSLRVGLFWYFSENALLHSSRSALSLLYRASSFVNFATVTDDGAPVFPIISARRRARLSSCSFIFLFVARSSISSGVSSSLDWSMDIANLDVP
mmetsp:Transcript_4312/g.14353  ORF Transcript_4312/g.14353 Transcript_4312/m.14353 type:complete len:251 (-) Transcript_4312:1205-1957(-)